MEYKVNDQGLNASVFIPFVNKVWPGDYDEEKTQTALSKTLNISAYENNVLVGCLRILSDGSGGGRYHQGHAHGQHHQLAGTVDYVNDISVEDAVINRNPKKRGCGNQID